MSIRKSCIDEFNFIKDFNYHVVSNNIENFFIFSQGNRMFKLINLHGGANIDDIVDRVLVFMNEYIDYIIACDIRILVQIRHMELETYEKILDLFPEDKLYMVKILID